MTELSIDQIRIDRIVRSDRRTFGLVIGRDGSLTLRAPRGAGMEDIERVVRKRRDWIIEGQETWRRRSAEAPPKRFVEGESFLFLGQAHELCIVRDIDRPIMFDGFFNLSERHLESARGVFAGWYKTRAKEIIGGRVERLAKAHGIGYRCVRITSAKRRWASCAKSGRLNFSYYLIMAPLPVIDYCIAHELAHISEMNHSPAFWRRVRELCPDYATHRRWLGNNGHRFVL